MAPETAYKSRLLLAKQKRKEVNHDAQLLKNRLQLLQTEEKKAWKKIEQTKERANELLRLRRENETKQKVKAKAAMRIEKETMLAYERNQKMNNASVSYRKEKDTKRYQKREDAHKLKEDKATWRKEIELCKRNELKLAMKKRQGVKCAEDLLRKNKEKKMRENEMAAKKRAEMKIQDEEEQARSTLSEVEKMEAMEIALIERLRKTQDLQKKAYAELETALGT